MEVVETPIQDGAGYVVRYAFEDIGEIHLDQEINMSSAFSIESPNENSITFSFQKKPATRPAELIVYNPVRPVVIDVDEGQRVKKSGNLEHLSDLENAGFSISLQPIGDNVPNCPY